MVRQALILLPIVLCLMSAKGCQTLEARATAAATTEGKAKAETSLPDLDASCTAKVGRVVPTASEPRVVTLKRWDVLAENRDRKSNDCAAWWADYRANVSANSQKGQ
jgi:hypothetical protein